MIKISFVRIIYFLLFCFLSTIASADFLPIHWIAQGDNGEIIARAITQQAQCPMIALDKKTEPMQLRARPIVDFPVTVCETKIPSNIHRVKIGNESLTLPKKNVRRIVVIGDTGCRLKGIERQVCDDPEKWPFKKIADTAARWKPDLVIHVGDYYYRENNGNNWNSWNADFFTPASTLLKAAPWIMVRGNHENCQRGGNAWFRFLDHSSYKNECKDNSAPYAVPIGDVTLFILDSTNASDFSAPVDEVKEFSAQLQRANQMDAKNIWLITHKPFWSVKKPEPNTLQVALMNNLSPRIKLLLAGHIHWFEALSPLDNRPPQIISGNSGTQLDASSSATKKDMESLHWSRFGYLTLENTREGWIAEPRDVDGKILARCSLKDKKLICLERAVKNG